ncbi:TPA: hypothetical protein G9G43_003946 [Salmonella enterica subsp. enterica serovar Montevideo]|uniref:Uncharacterized protein n=1 Tax=Salmonella montevideo TaxID=115981 RepID=A0A741Q0H5_SALMO|nr:hypothetical protein [Salmonella enterica subsp. enterica serovar Montevideo]
MQNSYYSSIIFSVRYRQFPSGQSDQLSTGTVKKPTSPVGFFTSEVCRLAPGRKKSTRIGALRVETIIENQTVWRLSCFVLIYSENS